MAYRLFDLKTPQDRTNLGTLDRGSAPTLTPTGGAGLIDIRKDYAWTLNLGEPARTNVPEVNLKEFRLTQSGLVAAINYWTYAIRSVINDQFTDPYRALYPAAPTGFVYSFPYFADHNHEIQNRWESSQIDLSIPGVENLLPGIGKLASVEGWETLAKTFATGVGHEIPQVYTSGSIEEIPVNFVLLNTTTSDDVEKNWEFCYLFAYQNLQNRRNSILVQPPVFYALDIPGVKYSPASYVSGFRITNIGQTKLIKLTNGIVANIPEAYGVSITFRDLIPQSQNMMEAMRLRDFQKVDVTENSSDFFNNFSNIGQTP